MAEKTIPTVQNENQNEVSREVTRTPDRYVRPLVDIFETEDALTVIADMPGVGRETLNVKVEDNILTIEGHMAQNPRKASILEEFVPISFFREFELSEAVNQDKIEAALNNGVLTVTLPKQERVKPRKITVHVAG